MLARMASAALLNCANAHNTSSLPLLIPQLCMQVAGYVRTRSVDEVLDMVKHGLRGGVAAPQQNGVTIVGKRKVRHLLREGCLPASCFWACAAISWSCHLQL